MGLGVGRNRVDRVFRIAGLEGEHFKAVPGEDFFRRGQPRLAPFGVDLGGMGAAVNGQPGDRITN